ncbi:MAG: 2OG-Fe(II) oxygenase [Hyphomicrobiales bacterium]|nr:2OG-Fe(II) oxygenase [Hyphomicrobiales bacterium]MBV8823713.1 2OG-Fe(II) oxygenase [Hyphomicrobiales bacterium]
MISRSTAAARANPRLLSPEIEWNRVLGELDAAGHAVLPGVVDRERCAEMAALYQRPEAFRSHIVMQRHGFGQGEYRYFAYPLPHLVGELREMAYPPLARLANTWNTRLGVTGEYPPTLAAFTAQCHAAGQTRPTPLLLNYGPGDYNRLHQDLYGDLYFPIQMVVLLSEPGRDFTGGEFVLTELKPRMQSRVEVVPLRQGDACLFAVNHHPAKGTRGYYRAGMRHGVSQLRSGHRMTLGIIFHDAR